MIRIENGKRVYYPGSNFQPDPTIQQRRKQNGLFYFRRIDCGNMKLRQFITPTIVFSLSKGEIDGDGSKNWSFGFKQRKATNL